jgi:RNA polymerase sigma factor (sigma-70 family)
METTEDEQWIQAAQSGDEAAFGRLIERYKDNIFATVVAITGDFDAAHDIGQETFLRAWFGIARLEDAASFGPWLRTIARNRSRTFLERRQRQPARESIEVDELAHSGQSPAQDAERAERQRLVHAAMDRLPELSREVLMLHYLEGLTTPRMATQLGITEPAVRQRLRRARLLMQEEVEEMVADVIRDEAPGPDFTESVQALMRQARGLFQEVKYGAAVPVLESAREQAPDDTLVSMLLAEAYTFTRSAEDLQQDRGAYDRAMALLDEVLDREPGNMLARLRRASLRSNLAADDEVFAEQQAALEAARGGLFEAVAQLELARRHLTRGQADGALTLYDELLPKFPWMACVLHSEMGVAQAMKQDGAAALGHFERAVELTTPDAMEALQGTSKELMGEAYWAFWSTVDNLPVRQCQNHAWIGGLRSASGNMATARQHVRQAIDFLQHEEVGEARSMLRRELVRQMEQMFPALAATQEIQALKKDIETAG